MQHGIVNIHLDDGFAKYMKSRLPANYYKFEIEPQFILRLDWEPPTPFRGLKLFYTVGDFRIQSYATFVGMDIKISMDRSFYFICGIEYSWESLVFSFEYYHCNSGYFGTNVDTGDLLFSFDKAPIDGGYASLTYRFFSWLEIGGYYTYYYPNSDDKKGKDEYVTKSNAWFKDTCLSIRFDLNEYWIFKLEGHLIDGTAIMFGSDQDDPKDITEEFIVFAAKLSFMF